MQRSNKRMDNLLKGVKENNRAIHLITTQLKTTAASIKQTFEDMTMLLVQQLQVSTTLNHQLEELKLGIIDLANGKLSPLLIPLEILTSTLTDIQSILSKKYSGFVVAMNYASEMYHHSNFLYTRNNSVLYLTLKVPIVYSDVSLDLFKIISKPVPINETSKHATQLLDLPDYFAITQNQQFFVHMTQSQVDTCVGSKHIYCHLNLPLQPVLQDACTLALYANNPEKVKNSCNLRFVHNAIQPEIMELSSKQVLLYDTNVLSLECNSQHQMIKGCNFCLFDMPCHCSISSPHFYLPPWLMSCKNKTYDKLTTLHPVNLVLLQKFFKNDQFQQIFADTTFTNPLKVSVPEFKLYGHEMSNILANDAKDHLNLSTMVELAKDDQVVFQSLTEPLLDGQIPLPTVWPDTNGILALIAVSLTGLISFLLVYLLCKVNKLSATIMLLQLNEQVRASTTVLPSFIYKSESNVESQISFFNNIQLSWEHAIFFLISMSTILLFLLIFKVFKSQKNQPCLLLEITNIQTCVFVRIINLPICPSHTSFKVPDNISDIRIIGPWYRPKMQVSWPNFIVQSPLNETVFNIPEQISLGIYQARKLQNVLRSPFYVHLYSTKGGYLSPVTF